MNPIAGFIYLFFGGVKDDPKWQENFQPVSRGCGSFLIPGSLAVSCGRSADSGGLQFLGRGGALTTSQERRKTRLGKNAQKKGKKARKWEQGVPSPWKQLNNSQHHDCTGLFIKTCQGPKLIIT